MGFGSKLKHQVKSGTGLAGVLSSAYTGNIYKKHKERSAGRKVSATEKAEAESEASLQRGSEKGRARAEEIYGQTQAESGVGIQDVVARRKAMLDQTDPVSDAIRQQRNQQLRVLGGLSGASGVNVAGQQQQVARAAEGDIAKQLYKKQRADLGEQQKLMGNIASGQLSTEMAFMGLEKAGQYQAPPTSGGILEKCVGTVVFCTLLGQPDTGHALTQFRGFRDNYMQTTEQKKNEAKNYYKVSPIVVDSIRANENSESVFMDIHDKHLSPWLKAIEDGDNDEAYKVYKNMLDSLEKEYV